MWCPKQYTGSRGTENYYRRASWGEPTRKTRGWKKEQWWREYLIKFVQGRRIPTAQSETRMTVMNGSSYALVSRADQTVVGLGPLPTGLIPCQRVFQMFTARQWIFKGYLRTFHTQLDVLHAEDICFHLTPPFSKAQHQPNAWLWAAWHLPHY